MNANQIEEILRDETERESGHEERKGIISMSSLHLDDDEIIRDFQNGYKLDIFKKMKFYRGKLAEEGFIERMVNSGKFSSILVHQEISAYDGKLTGHPDIVLPNENIFFEYKSVPTIDILTEISKAKQHTYKIFSQVQSYLLWGKFVKAYIVYEAREGGYPFVVEMLPHFNKQIDVKEKAERILKRIEELKK